jgi:hypothetical protein
VPNLGAGRRTCGENWNTDSEAQNPNGAEEKAKSTEEQHKIRSAAERALTQGGASGDGRRTLACSRRRDRAGGGPQQKRTQRTRDRAGGANPSTSSQTSELVRWRRLLREEHLRRPFGKSRDSIWWRASKETERAPAASCNRNRTRGKTTRLREKRKSGTPTASDGALREENRKSKP